LINLLKNEFIKIFSKKGIYILLIIMFAFVCLINVIYKYSYKDETSMNNQYSKESAKAYEEELKGLSLDKEEDISTIISLKTEIQMSELSNKYGVDSWQSQIIYKSLYDIIYSINYNTYSKDKSKDEYETYKKKYDDIIARFDKDDWKYFANEELKGVNTLITDLESQKAKTTDKLQLKSIDENIEQAKLNKYTLDYRLKNNISYKNDYLNEAINNYVSSGTYLITYNKDDKTSNSANPKYDYNQTKSSMELSKYIFTHKVDINTLDNTRGILKSIFNNFEIFIIVFITIITGTIVADEFNKGTIKQLLIKPHTRFKILLSKYITSLSMILMVFVALVFMQLLVGGVLFGFGSLSIPIVVYNFDISKIQSFNIFVYLLILLVSKLPLFILLLTFIFLLSILTTNSAVAITIGIMTYVFSGIINNMAVYLDVKWLKFFPTLNWDFTQYLFGNVSQNKYLTIGLSAIMCISYFISLIIPSFILFQKKNIKNI